MADQEHNYVENLGKIYYLTRVQYQHLVDYGEIETYSLYFVKDTTELASNILSLYVGTAKQCDLLDITQDAQSWETPINFVDFENNYDIPEAYKIPDKMYFYAMDEGYYKILMWNEQAQQFYECGTPGNPLVVDGVTILEDSDHVISGVGANVEGKTFTVSNNTYIGGTGDTLFNDYTNNVAAGGSSGGYNNVFGTANISLGKHNTNFGNNNTASATTSYSLIGGSTNTVTGNDFGVVWGKNNTVSVSSDYYEEYSIVIGNTNTVSTPHTIVYGRDNSVSSGSDHVVFGSNNQFLGNCSNVFISGTYNKPINTTNTYIFGSSNGYSSNLVNLNNDLIVGDNNSFNGNYLNKSCIFGFNNALQGAGIEGLYMLGSGNSFSGYCSGITGMVVGKTNTTSSSVSFEESLVFGDLNSNTGNFQNSIMFGRSNSNTASVTFSQIFGNGNTLSSANHTTIFGQNNTSSSLRNHTVIVGYGNTINNDGYYFGQNLTVSSSNSIPYCFMVGQYNDTTVTDSIFTIANGSGSSTRSDVMRTSTTGLLQLCGTDGNAVTKNGETIESTRTTLTSIAADNSSYTSAYLPMNGQELLLSSTYTVSSITITSIATMNYDNGRGAATKSTTPDYNSVIIFKKDPSVTSVEDLMTNFTSSTSNKIYLLNKDLDITTYSIIHIMLFHDGFNICAIVSGYEEDAPV